MINGVNPNVANTAANIYAQTAKLDGAQKPAGFDKAVSAVKDQLGKVDDAQNHANQSVVDLLSGKDNDITSVVSAVAKADMSFKLLVGVRNKLIEAYKQTMHMQV